MKSEGIQRAPYGRDGGIGKTARTTFMQRVGEKGEMGLQLVGMTILDPATFHEFRLFDFAGGDG